MRVWIAGLTGLIVGGAFTAALWSAMKMPESAAFGSDAWQLIGAAAGAFVSVMAAFGVVQYQENREATRVRSFVLATINDVIRAADRLSVSLKDGHGAHAGSGSTRAPEHWKDLSENAKALIELQQKAMKRLPRIEENLYKLDITTLQTVFEVEDLLPSVDGTLDEMLVESNATATRMYGGVVPPEWAQVTRSYAGRLKGLRGRLNS